MRELCPHHFQIMSQRTCVSGTWQSGITACMNSFPSHVTLIYSCETQVGVQYPPSDIPFISSSLHKLEGMVFLICANHVLTTPQSCHRQCASQGLGNSGPQLTYTARGGDDAKSCHIHPDCEDTLTVCNQFEAFSAIREWARSQSIY